MKQHFLIVVAGPTAVGKTALALRLAQHFKTEVISADARQFYREISIGTAKPSEEELSAVPHHFINSISVQDDYNVGRFENEALQTLNNIYKKHNTAVMVGGSGLFIRAVCEGLDDLPEANAAVREELSTLLKEKGITALQELLKEKDPDYYGVIDLNNPQRLLRALEVCLSTGKPFSSFHSNKARQRGFTPIKIALYLSREELYARINKRVDVMMDNGLLAEAKTLFPYRHLNALQTVGYAELFEFMEGKYSLDKAIELIKQHTRNYAKRQLTWFRKEKDMGWFTPGNWEEILKYTELRIKSGNEY